MSNLKGKAYSRETYLFKKKYPIKWKVIQVLKQVAQWLRSI